jgi:hypothetical protein
MSHRIREEIPAKTPIERIFERVMHREMTSQERLYFQLGPKIKPLRVSPSKQTRAA